MRDEELSCLCAVLCAFKGNTLGANAAPEILEGFVAPFLGKQVSPSRASLSCVTSGRHSLRRAGQVRLAL
jgi:hypothetical protein